MYVLYQEPIQQHLDGRVLGTMYTYIYLLLSGSVFTWVFNYLMHFVEVHGKIDYFLNKCRDEDSVRSCLKECVNNKKLDKSSLQVL